MFEVLGPVTRLNVATARFFGFDLNDIRPQVGVGAQRLHYDVITLRCFGVPRTGVVLFENRMMNNSGWHEGQLQSRMFGGAASKSFCASPRSSRCRIEYSA